MFPSTHISCQHLVATSQNSKHGRKTSSFLVLLLLLLLLLSFFLSSTRQTITSSMLLILIANIFGKDKEKSISDRVESFVFFGFYFACRYLLQLLLMVLLLLSQPASEKMKISLFTNRKILLDKNLYLKIVV